MFDCVNIAFCPRSFYCCIATIDIEIFDFHRGSKFVRTSLSRDILAATMTIWVAGCAISVKKTPGMDLYASGKYDEAVPILKDEVAAGSVEARYSLGLAYRDGIGVPKDPQTAEILLTGAAIGGDPRAASEVRHILAAENLRPLDKTLYDRWGKINILWRDFGGKIDFTIVPVSIRYEMAAIYDQPCPGRIAQPEAAQTLRNYVTRSQTYVIVIPR